MKQSLDSVKRGFAQMLKGGVIIDVTSPDDAKLAEHVGAVAVLVTEKLAADTRGTDYIGRMADPKVITEISSAVTIPVIAKVRLGHISEAQILAELNVDMIFESDDTPAPGICYIDKCEFSTPFVCGASTLSGALKRIDEGASMIRINGDSGSGSVSELIGNIRTISSEVRALVENRNSSSFLAKKADEYGVCFELVEDTAKIGRLPVACFAAGGISTPADVALAMHMGCDGVFVGSGIFKAQHPDKMAKALVFASDNYSKPDILAKVTSAAGRPMPAKKKLQA
ncbi:MAG: pyridoxal 5'-phosphate synthase lyase subunit PdxS [archaeon]